MTPISKRQVTAAVIGNALEFYDFTVFALFTAQIGHAFFPSTSHFAEIMLALATFGVGFIPRPIGSIVIGRFADRHGRRPAMLLSFAMMGVGILGLALTPAYAKIGIFAPILVVTWRLCQGFAVGGEVGSTTAFLVEAAPPQRRAFYACWQAVSQNFAFIAGGLTGLILGQILGQSALDAWGWRIAFGLGGLILPVGLYLRRNLPETLHHPEAASEHQPLGIGLRDHGRILSLGLALIASSTVSTYILTYMTTYAKETLHLGTGLSLAAQVVNGGAGMVFGLLGGWLADRYGRRPLLIWPRVILIAAVWPAFFLMGRFHNAASLLGGIAVIAAMAALSSGALFTAITESMRKEVRGLAFGGVYATAVAVFGGTTGNIVHWLIHVTHDPMAPTWYILAFAIVGLIASVAIKESAPIKTLAVPN